MKRFYAAAMIAALAFPAAASAQWTSQVRDDFDGGNEITATAQQVPAGAFTADRNFDYASTTAPALGTPTGGDGTGFLLTANEDGTAATSFLTVATGGGNQALETMLLPYLADANTGGSTTFGGLGVRVTNPGGGAVQDGYYAEFRTDTSGTYGSYLSLHKYVAGTGEFLGRYYFQEGSGGISAGSLTGSNASKVIRLPEAPSVNTWIKARMEIEDVGTTDARLRLLIDDVVIVDWVDTAPVTGGDALLLHHDPYNSASAPPGSVGMIYDYVEFFNGTSDVNDWLVY